MDFAADLAALYADFGVAATRTAAVGGAVTPGQVILDQPGQTLIGGEILATDYSLRYITSSFPATKRGDTFLVGGITYTAREAAQPLLDGLEHIVPLSR